MGHHEVEYEPSSTPKLSLFSLPSKPQEPPGMLTPPLHSLASIPFQWEEAPGKPRPCTTTTQSKPKSARSLELPPRLLSEAKVTNFPSPTTVLEGPYVGRSLSYTLSFSKLGSSFGSSESLGSKRESRKRAFFGSSKWGSFKNNKEFVGGCLDLPSSIDDDGGGGDGGGTKEKITRVRRRRSLLSISQTKSHLWANIYESFKQVVPWRRRQEKLRKTG